MQLGSEQTSAEGRAATASGSLADGVEKGPDQRTRQRKLRARDPAQNSDEERVRLHTTRATDPIYHQIAPLV